MVKQIKIYSNGLEGNQEGLHKDNPISIYKFGESDDFHVVFVLSRADLSDDGKLIRYGEVTAHLICGGEKLWHKQVQVIENANILDFMSALFRDDKDTQKNYNQYDDEITELTISKSIFDQFEPAAGYKLNYEDLGVVKKEKSSPKR